jgi:hypothetical protein
MKTYIVIFMILLERTTLCKDLNETERTARAAFIQRLLTKQKYLEGKIRLVGGPSDFEGIFNL